MRTGLYYGSLHAPAGHRPLPTEASKADVIFLKLGGGERETFLGGEKKKVIDVLMLEGMEKKSQTIFWSDCEKIPEKLYLEPMKRKYL